MKTYAYLILAVIVCSILVQPLIEIALVCKDRVEVGAAITNSVRAAKKECYSYYSMRDLDAEADREKFMEVFGDAFSKSLNLRMIGSAGTSMVFESIDDHFNKFTVECSFTPSRYGNRQQTSVHVKSSSDYKFKTKYLREAQNIIKNNSGIYKLTHERWYDMSIAN